MSFIGELIKLGATKDEIDKKDGSDYEVDKREYLMNLYQNLLLSKTTKHLNKMHIALSKIKIENIICKSIDTLEPFSKKDIQDIIIKVLEKDLKYNYHKKRSTRFFFIIARPIRLRNFRYIN